MGAFWKSDTFYAVLAITIGTFALGLVFWHIGGTDPMWAVTSFVLVYDPNAKAALTAGAQRLALTLLGVIISVAMLSLFGLHKWVLPASLALSALICGLVLHFRNPWRVVLITVCLVVGSSLIEPGASDSHIALMRACEVFVGSLVAILLSWAVARIRARHRAPF